jgi:hypothetical protein
MKTGRFSLHSLGAIKSKPSKLVNWTCALVAVTLLVSISTADENLPDINAKEYSARVEKRSTSGRVYLLSVPNPGQQLPADGQIILLKQAGVPVMAFRVLKEYPDKTQFAGKWVRRYGDVQQLSPGSQYDAFEKVSDREPPALTHQDQKDLKEVEAPVAPAPVPVAPQQAEVTPPLGAPTAAVPPPVLAVPPTPEVAVQQAAPSPIPSTAAPPSPVESAPPLPPTAPITPDAAVAPIPSPAPPPVVIESPAPPLAEASPLPEVAPEPPAPEASPATEAAIPSPADLSGPGQVPAPAQTSATSNDIPAPGSSPSPAPQAKGFDSNLDATTSPQPEASPDLSGDDMSSIMVEEVKHFDDDSNSLSVGVGLYRNLLNSYSCTPQCTTPPTTVAIYNSAGFVRYSRTLVHRIHFKSKNWQDDLTVDGTLGFYKYLGTSSNGDTYTVVPASLALRYTLLPNEDFGFFVYAGFVQNVVVQTINADPNVQSGLNSFLPDIGVGMLFRIGPSWYMRGDAGVDLFGVSISLRF